MVDDSKNRVMLIGLGEADNKIHSYLLEWKGSGVRGDFVHRWAGAVCDNFVLLTCRAPLDVFCDPRTHVRPPVVPLGLSDSFVATRVSSYEAFMYNSHDLSF